MIENEIGVSQQQNLGLTSSRSSTSRSVSYREKIRENEKKEHELRNKLYTAILSRVWSTLKGVDEITYLIIDEFVEYSVRNDISSPSSELIQTRL